MIRCDCGTENTLIAEAQAAMRANHTDTLAGDKSVRFGTSPANVVSTVYCL